jgi:microsomal dipeptidase-like Zn-dependent dipeptidase
MGHFGPGELDGQVGLNAFDRIFGDFEGFARQRDIKFVITVAMIFINMFGTPKAVTIGYDFKYGHSATTARTRDGREFTDAFRAVRHELTETGRIFATVFLKMWFV